MKISNRKILALLLVMLMSGSGGVYAANAGNRRIIFFICKPSTFAKLHFQGVDGIHGILVGGVEKFLLGCLLNAQCLIIVAVERVECIAPVLIGTVPRTFGLLYDCLRHTLLQGIPLRCGLPKYGIECHVCFSHDSQLR